MQNMLPQLDEKQAYMKNIKTRLIKIIYFPLIKNRQKFDKIYSSVFAWTFLKIACDNDKLRTI